MDKYKVFFYRPKTPLNLSVIIEAEDEEKAIEKVEESGVVVTDIYNLSSDD
jgi:hypothetical protein